MKISITLATILGISITQAESTLINQSNNQTQPSIYDNSPQVSPQETTPTPPETPDFQYDTDLQSKLPLDESNSDQKTELPYDKLPGATYEHPYNELP